MQKILITLNDQGGGIYGMELLRTCLNSQSADVKPSPDSSDR